MLSCRCMACRLTPTITSLSASIANCDRSADLKKRFYDASRQWHPDRFTRSARGRTAYSLEATAMLNDALPTSAGSGERAEYLLQERFRYRRAASKRRSARTARRGVRIEHGARGDARRRRIRPAATRGGAQRSFSRCVRIETAEACSRALRRETTRRTTRRLDQIRGRPEPPPYIQNLVTRWKTCAERDVAKRN